MNDFTDCELAWFSEGDSPGYNPKKDHLFPGWNGISDWEDPYESYEVIHEDRYNPSMFVHINWEGL